MGRWRGGQLIFREIELFEFLKEKVPDLESGKSTDYFDAYSLKQRAVFELKCRRTHYDDLMIEQHKWRNMVEIGLLRHFTAYYISSTPLGIWCWQLDALKPPQWVMKTLPNKTDFAGSKVTTRPVGFLHINDALDLLRHTENPFAKSI